jgi:hypothetical protein
VEAEYFDDSSDSVVSIMQMEMENSETEDVNLETGWKPQVCSEPLKEDE